MPAYSVFTSEGKKVNYGEMISGIKDADVIFFGELHDNPIVHWLQLETTKSLYELKKDKLILGAEMFESDNQLIMDEFLGGLISENKFEEEARLWPNYKTDYKPLVQFAKEMNLSFIAANIPRRYAALVFSKGFEGLNSTSDEAKEYFAPLPIQYDAELACYKNMLNMGGMGMKHSNENLPKAQAVKDATMAHFITKYWKEGTQVLFYNGTYHSDNHQGIVWYLKNANKNLKIKTIASTMQKDVTALDDEAKGTADFILVTPENITRTH